MSNAIAATYHHREALQRARGLKADPVSYDLAPRHSQRALRLCVEFSLGYFVEFLAELSGCGTAETFDAACRNHADAVAMPAGGPWPAPMPAEWECVEPVGGSDWR